MTSVGAEYCIGGPDYAILEDQGCTSFVLITPLSMGLMFCWPVIIGVILLVYGCESLGRFYMSLDSVCQKI